jgi:CubicO group peptidase (beta-lactamase class C family)
MTEAAVRVDGMVAPGFEPVRDAFEANFRRGEVGAACCVYVDGRPVVDLRGGTVAPGTAAPYTERTLQLVASVTKGAMAICAHRLAERGELDFDAPVTSYWPEFGAAGKERIPVRWLFSHQAGLPAVDKVLTMPELYTWTPIVDALAAQEPYWEPGTAHGYHGMTYGWLVGEVLTRITGLTPGRLLAREIAGPLGIDFWVGLPDAEHDRVAPLIPAPAPPPGAAPDPLAALLRDEKSLAFKAFFIPNGLFRAMNDPAMWRAELPAVNGMSTAASLAKMYAACLGEVGGVRLLRQETLAAATVQQTSGTDRVTGFGSRFGLGFMLSFPERPMAGDGSFGHYGLGGSVGFAHPERGLAFGYTVNQMLPGGVADPRSMALVDATLGCLGR